MKTVVVEWDVMVIDLQNPQRGIVLHAIQTHFFAHRWLVVQFHWSGAHPGPKSLSTSDAFAKQCWAWTKVWLIWHFVARLSENHERGIVPLGHWTSGSNPFLLISVYDSLSVCAIFRQKIRAGRVGAIRWDGEEYTCDSLARMLRQERKRQIWEDVWDRVYIS